MNWLEDIWTIHPKNSRTRAERWELIILRWLAPENETENNPELLRMVKRILTIENNYERMASSVNHESLEERLKI